MPIRTSYLQNSAGQKSFENKGLKK
jgi:hypothetical protein